MRLSYCTNVHPAEDLDGVLAQLTEQAGPIREQAGLDVLGVGLWLPASLAHELAGSPSARARLRAVLDEHRLEVLTVNAFPYAGFHDEVVKLGVYSPDWTDPRRAAYTMDVARVLADLAPVGSEASISTLPLGWREGWDEEQDRVATAALSSVVGVLAELEQETGVRVRLAIEPEPGCVLDTLDDVVRWLGERPRLLESGHVGACVDTCHLAVSFADPRAAVEALTAARIPVVKVQASAALELTDPLSTEALAPYAEPRYLHQVRGLRPDGSVRRADDLPEALAVGPAWSAGPWRVHVHVPLHQQPDAPLRSTTDVLVEAVRAVADAPGGRRAPLDVETYTWSVLPAAHQPSTLSAGVAAELRWLLDAAGDLIDTPAPATPRSLS